MEAIERYSGIFQGDEIRVTRRFADFAPGDAILPNDVLLFSDAQYRLSQVPTSRSRWNADAGAVRSDRPRSSGRRSGRCATSASNICRPACCISSTGAVLPPAASTPIPTAARPATRSRKRSSRVSWNWWNAIRTPSGGTIDCRRAEVDLGQFDDSYVRDLRVQLCRNRTPALGARHHQRSRHSELRRDVALDGKRAGFYRVRLRLALRRAHRHVAGADRAEPVSLHRPHGVAERRDLRPRWRRSWQLAKTPLFAAERQSGDQARPGLEVRPSRHARAGAGLRSNRQARRASISWSSIRPAPISRCRSSA